MDLKNDFSLQDKVIIVTGGTGVLGEAFINGIAKAGGTVGVLGRNEKVADERVASIKNSGGKAIALIADVTKEDQLNEAKKKAIYEFGKIDGLVNAAGGNMPGAIVQPDQDVFNLNFKATLAEINNILIRLF